MEDEVMNTSNLTLIDSEIIQSYSFIEFSEDSGDTQLLISKYNYSEFLHFNQHKVGNLNKLSPAYFQRIHMLQFD